MLLTDLNNSLAMVLTIGDGRALEPLSARRATAAMPFGGSYRIIDFALTNCLHSGLRRVMVMTQYNALSLHNHIRDGWSIYNTDLGEYITPVTPPISDTVSKYSGNADALYKNLYLLEGTKEEHVLVVSGEQIYRMDYAAVLSWHTRKRADITIGCVPSVNANRAPFPVTLELDGDNVTAVQPTDQPGGAVAAASVDAWWPMGVAVFRREQLIEMLRAMDGTPLGTLGISAFVGRHLANLGKVTAYRFGGTAGRVTQDRYWRRLDSLDAYYSANMDLLEREPPLDLYQSDWPIRTYQTQRPPARTVPGPSDNEGICVNSIVSGGTVIAGGGVNHSVLGNRVYVEDSATVEDSILFSDVRIGEGSQIRKCIIDRHVHVPAGEQIGFDHAADAARFTVTDEGVVVIPANYTFDGT